MKKQSRSLSMQDAIDEFVQALNECAEAKRCADEAQAKYDNAKEELADARSILSFAADCFTKQAMEGVYGL